MWKPAMTDKPNTPIQPPASDKAPARPQFTAGGFPSGGETPQSLIGKGMCIKGEVIGSESLYIDGRLEGAIEVSKHYVHIGEHANVEATVNAGELIVRGKLHGNVAVDDRLEIRAGGTLVGDVIARRVSIEDGAYFKGSIDMRGEQRRQPEDMPAKNDSGLGTQRAPAAIAASA